MKAIIMGADSRIGKATAFCLDRDARSREDQPAQLLPVELAGDRLNAVARELADQRAQVAGVVADLTQASAPLHVVDAARKAWNGLEVLISNAGVIEHGSLLESPWTATTAASHSTHAPRGCWLRPPTLAWQYRRHRIGIGLRTDRPARCVQRQQGWHW